MHQLQLTFLNRNDHATGIEGSGLLSMKRPNCNLQLSRKANSLGAKRYT